MGGKRAPDAIVARIAGRQHGVISLGQLKAAGLTADAIHKRTRAGRLHRLHRGVFAVGHPGLSHEGRWMAAVLACGETAVLSHRSAGALWELLPAKRGTVDVTIATRSGRRPRRGIRIHRPTSLERGAITRRKGIPVTSPARTIADLRRTADPALTRRALRQAAILGLPVKELTELDGSRSELEGHFLTLCRRHRLPAPKVNVRIGPFLVDFLWRDLRLIVGVDGYRYHRGRLAFEADRSRDVELKLAGYEVVRLTYRQVVHHREQTARRLTVLLSRAREGRSPS